MTEIEKMFELQKEFQKLIGNQITIKNRNKELVANNYNEDVQDLTKVLIKETPEGQDLAKVKDDLEAGGAVLTAEQKKYNNSFNVSKTAYLIIFTIKS